MQHRCYLRLWNCIDLSDSVHAKAATVRAQCCCCVLRRKRDSSRGCGDEKIASRRTLEGVRVLAVDGRAGFEQCTSRDVTGLQAQAQVWPSLPVLLEDEAKLQSAELYGICQL